MTGFVNLDAAYDIGTLTDWYISSVTDDPPVRTDEHIEKLFNDFYVIPKDTPAADVAPVKHGHWVYNQNGHDWGLGAWECSLCHSVNNNLPIDKRFSPYVYAGSKYCPNCGAKMDGGENNGT